MTVAIAPRDIVVTAEFVPGATILLDCEFIVIVFVDKLLNVIFCPTVTAVGNNIDPDAPFCIIIYTSILIVVGIVYDVYDDETKIVLNLPAVTSDNVVVVPDSSLVKFDVNVDAVVKPPFAVISPVDVNVP